MNFLKKKINKGAVKINTAPFFMPLPPPLPLPPRGRVFIRLPPFWGKWQHRCR